MLFLKTDTDFIGDSVIKYLDIFIYLLKFVDKQIPNDILIWITFRKVLFIVPI